jgi:hypothetical protein
LVELAQAMHAGWALMSPEAAVQLEAQAGRRLLPKPRGRPRKVRDSEA